MSLKFMFFAAWAASLLLVHTSYAALKNPNAEKQAILITSFGTSQSNARSAIDSLVTAAQKAFPNADVRLAFTSNIIRRKLAREGKDVPPSPVLALASLNDEGFKKVCVMPTHVIPGEEFDEIQNVVEAWHILKGKYCISDLRLGKVFLSSAEDCDVMADVIIRRFAQVPPDTAVVLMGHGTPHHHANAMYCQLQAALDKKSDGRFFIGTVENTPLLRDVIAALKKALCRKVLLSPLMIVAGDHAQNDMADKNNPESWYSVLTNEGYSVTPHLQGLGEDSGIAAMFVSHLQAELEHCDR